MRLLYVLNGYNDGGAELGLAELVEDGFFSGHHLSVCGIVRDRGTAAYRRLRNSLGPDVSYMFDEPVPRARHLAIGAIRLARMIRQERPDALILSLPQSDFMGRIVSLASPHVKVISFFHTVKFNRSTADLLLWATSFLTDAVMYDSPDTLETITRRFPISGKPAWYVPLVNLSPRREPRPWVDRPVTRLVAIGRLVGEKNYFELIRAVRMLLDAGIPVHLDIGGEGELRNELEATIHELGLDDHVSLLGFVDPGPLRGRSDIFVQASRVEGLCKAVLEAMADGMLVVSTDVGGMKDYGVDRVNMVKSEAPEASAISAAIAAAISSPDRDGIRARALSTVAQRFSGAVVAAQRKQVVSGMKSLVGAA